MTKSLFFLSVFLPVAVPLAAMQYLRAVHVADAPLLAQVAAAIGMAAWESMSPAAGPLRDQSRFRVRNG